MGFATHLGPWLLGTVKNTTGTTAGTIRNVGVTNSSQDKIVTFTDVNASLTGTAAVLPAGARIIGIQMFTTADFSAATTIKFSIGATDLCTAVTITTGGVYGVSPTNSAAVASLMSNVGTSDAIITYTTTKGGTLTTGAVTLVVRYSVRESDGSSAPAQG